MLFLWYNGGDVVRRTRFVGCFAKFVVLLFGGCERGHALCWGATAVQVCPATARIRILKYAVMVMVMVPPAAASAIANQTDRQTDRHTKVCHTVHLITIASPNSQQSKAASAAAAVSQYDQEAEITNNSSSSSSILVIV